MAVFQKDIQSFVAVLVASASCKKQNSGFTCLNFKKFDGVSNIIDVNMKLVTITDQNGFCPYQIYNKF